MGDVLITGRTFPSYKYFSQATQLGQDSLERLLHAYAVKDCEVGYCQGLSFVAGMILIHVSILLLGCVIGSTKNWSCLSKLHVVGYSSISSALIRMIAFCKL